MTTLEEKFELFVGDGAYDSQGNNILQELLIFIKKETRNSYEQGRQDMHKEYVSDVERAYNKIK